MEKALLSAVPTSGGHQTTEAIVNDLTDILLGLFISWEDLHPFFRRSTEQGNNCSQLWATVEPTLSPHNRDFASNIDLLRKSKEYCQADAKLRESATESAAYDLYDHDIGEVQSTDFYSDDDEGVEPVHLQDETFNAETLLAAYDSMIQPSGNGRKSYSPLDDASLHWAMEQPQPGPLCCKIFDKLIFSMTLWKILLISISCPSSP